MATKGCRLIVALAATKKREYQLQARVATLEHELHETLATLTTEVGQLNTKKYVAR